MIIQMRKAFLGGGEEGREWGVLTSLLAAVLLIKTGKQLWQLEQHFFKGQIRQSCSYPVAISTAVQIELSTHPVPLQQNDLLDSPPSSFHNEVVYLPPTALSTCLTPHFGPWWFFSVLALLSCKMCSPFCCATWVPY